MKDMNLVRLIGKVVDRVKGAFSIEITEVNRNEETFVETLPIVGTLPKGTKKGDRVEAVCQFVQGEDKITRLHARRVEKTDIAVDLNAAEMVGRAARPFEYYDGSRGNPFGNLLLRVGNQFVRGVAFAFFAQKLDRTCTRDSRVKLFGRVQMREYTRKNTGEKASILEIVANPDKTEVLFTAPIVDEMADIRDLGAVEPEPVPNAAQLAVAENPL